MLCKVVPTTEEALTARLLQSTMQALELYGIYLGKELGLYTALKSGGKLTPPELAQAAGIAPRYAREWLEQQAVAGLLHVDASPHLPMRGGTGSRQNTKTFWRRRTIPRTSPRSLRWWQVSVAPSSGSSRLPHGGRCGISALWCRLSQGPGRDQPPGVPHRSRRALDSRAPDIHAALMSSRMRVADVGCGAGWSTIALAGAFPKAEVVGFDADEASVRDARENAAAHGVARALRDSRRRVAGEGRPVRSGTGAGSAP